MPIKYDPDSIVAYYGHLVLLKDETRPEEGWFVTSKNPLYQGREDFTIFLERLYESVEYDMYFTRYLSDGIVGDATRFGTITEALDHCLVYYDDHYFIRLMQEFPLKKSASNRSTLETNFYTVDFWKDRDMRCHYEVYEIEGPRLFSRHGFLSLQSCAEDFAKWEFNTEGVQITARMYNDHVAWLADILYARLKQIGPADQYPILGIEGKIRYTLDFRDPLFEFHGSGWFWGLHPHGRQRGNYLSSECHRDLWKATKRIVQHIAANGYERDFNLPTLQKREE